MRRGVLFILALFGMLIVPVLPAAAETSDGEPISQTITLTGIVPEMRILYVNQQGYLVKVVGNTDKNIAPSAVGLDNKKVEMNDSIQRQYREFLKLHGGHLQAGVEYEVNPVTINNEPSNQTISVANQPLAATITLGSGRNG